MKFLLILLFITVQAEGQIAASFGTGRNQPSATRKPLYHNHPPTPLLFEDFENPVGYDLAGWGEDIAGDGVVNEDYTATVLFGTQSLFVDEGHDDQTRATNSFAANGHVWVAFRFRITKLDPVNSTFFRLNDASGSCQLRLTLNNDGGTVQIQFACTGTLYPTGFGMTTNTTYTVWVEYWKDNGANSYASLAFSTGSIRPTSGGNFVEATGTSTGTDASMVQLGKTSSEAAQEVDFIMDHLLIDDVQINDWP